MARMVEPTIGERIRELRRSIYTQVELAVAADVSVDVIRKLEQGRRLTASIGTLQRIARALDVGVADLLGRSDPAPAEEGQAGLSAIRDALTSIDDLLGAVDDVDVPPVEVLARSVTYGWGAYWAGRYELLAALLPDLLVTSRAVLRACPVAAHPRAIDLAAQVHQLTANTLVGLDAPDLAYLAARESLRFSGSGEDPLRDAAMRLTLNYVLSRQGQFVEAEHLAVDTAENCRPGAAAGPGQLSVYGGLLLGAATAAARERRTGAARELLAEASVVADRAGVDRTDYEVVFGPSNMIMQAVDVAVVTEDFPAAAQLARRMPGDSALPLAAPSRHLADVAHTQVRLGRTGPAESTLLMMERAAPEWTAHHRLPRILIGELLTRGRPSARLRELADRLNVRPRQE
ncbi:MAG: helix-turn-helix domain-containing protein [Pseudonocardiaceae bacterium]